MAPFLLRAMLWGVLLIFIAFILRRLIYPGLYSLVNALIVLYFIDRFRLLTALLAPLGRIVFTAEMLGGTLFLIWLMWRKRSLRVGPIASELSGRAVRLALLAGLIIFPVTLLANVFGYVNLANLLGGGAIRSAYVGAAAYATLMTLEGLIIISLRTRPLCSMRVVQFNRPMIQRRICIIAELLAFFLLGKSDAELFRTAAAIDHEY